MKDILTIEIRKLETEIIKMNEQYSADPQSSSTNSQKIAQPVQRCYDVKLTNYGIIVFIFISHKFVSSVMRLFSHDVFFFVYKYRPTGLNGSYSVMSEALRPVLFSPVLCRGIS